MATRKRARQTHGDLVIAIEEAAGKAHKPKAIEAMLRDMKRDGELPSGATVPNLRTIQRIVAEHRPPDATEAWSVADANGDDAALILPVLAHVVSLTEGRETAITHAAAVWIVRLRRAVPDLAIPPLWHVIRRYMSREASKKPTTDLDLLLAFAPWRSEPAYSGWSTKQRQDEFLRTLQSLKDVTGQDNQVTLFLAQTAIEWAEAEENESRSGSRSTKEGKDERARTKAGRKVVRGGGRGPRRKRAA